MNKYINQVQTKDIQKSIDQGYLATFNKYSDDTIYIFAHYTNVENVMFNKIPLLNINDEIIINNNDIKTKYIVEKIETINKNTLFEKQANLVLITCTKDFNKSKYFCVYAKKIGE